MDSEAQARFDLIRENLAEVLNPELIESILIEKRNPRIYWGKIRFTRDTQLMRWLTCVSY